MKKKVLSLALALMMALTLLPTAALAADNDFAIIDGTLTRYIRPDGDAVIPDGVTSIGEYAFCECRGLTSVIIPNSVTSIGEYAFADCKSLTSVTIPSSITSISKGVFAASGLTSVTIPNSVTSIGPDAFDDCYSLTDIYYSGSEAQWKAIDIGRANSPLTRATIHYNSAAPQQPVQQPTQSDNLAYASTQSVLVNGQKVEFQMYALKDANGNDTNFIKLRDLAQILNGTAARFEVGWNGAVNIETGKAYTPNGSEMNTPFSGNRVYEAATAVTNINGSTAHLSAFILKDDNGGAYTYYQLRDLGEALDFKVGWSAERGIYVETIDYLGGSNSSNSNN